MTLVSAFVAFSASVEVSLVRTGWLHSPFEFEYHNYHRILAARHWQRTLPLVPQYFLIENLHTSQFYQKYPSITDGQCKNVV